jgi:dihydrofolate reductase
MEIRGQEPGRPSPRSQRHRPGPEHPAQVCRVHLGADIAAEVAKLKAQPGRELLVVGSAELAQTPMARDLVDEYRLMVHPIVLGGGKKQFREGTAAKTMRLIVEA